MLNLSVSISTSNFFITDSYSDFINGFDNSLMGRPNLKKRIEHLDI